MPYCPICNLHGVAEDHAIQVHGLNQSHYSSTSTFDNTLQEEIDKLPKYWTPKSIKKQYKAKSSKKDKNEHSI